jgi:hypothetical protein
MENSQALISQLDTLFHPRSIAIVGLPREMKSGSIFLMGLMDQGFPGISETLSDGGYSRAGNTAGAGFRKSEHPFFDTAERAIATYALFRRYHLWREEMT